MRKVSLHNRFLIVSLSLLGALILTFAVPAIAPAEAGDLDSVDGAFAPSQPLVPAVNQASELDEAEIPQAGTNRRADGPRGGLLPPPAEMLFSSDGPAAPLANLALSKTDSPDPVIAGNSLTYILTTTNPDPDIVNDAVLTDTLPSAVAFDSASAGCNYDSGPHEVVCNLGPISTTLNSVVNIFVTVNENATGSLVNNASVTSAISDPVGANASATTIVNTSADLALSKTDSPDPVIAGNSLTYNLQVTNSGPSQATGVTVTDNLPAGVTYDSYTSSQGPCSHSAGTVTCTPGTVASSGTVDITITVTVNPSTSGMITNNASVSSATSDPIPSNNSAPQSTMVNTSADLALSKTDSPDPVIAGNSLTYTLTVINNGPSQATGVTVTDNLPAGVTYDSYTSSQGPCSHSAGTVTCTPGTVASSGTVDITITVTVNSGTSGMITNNASVSSATSDPFPSNNSAPQSTMVNTSADLALSKTDSPDPVLPLGTLTYNLQVTNITGPSTASSVSVTDNLPADVTPVSAMASQGTCDPPAGTITCSLGDIAVGGTANITITVTVNANASGSLVNNASVSSATSDPNGTNNSATASTTVIAADLALSKTDSPDPVLPLGTLTYNLQVTNNGPSLASTVSVSDTLPAGVTYVSAMASQGPCSHLSGTVTCSPGSMASGGTVGITITVTVNAGATGSLINNASVTSVTSDPNSANNSASATTTVTPAADLALTKADAPDPVIAGGGNLTYTLQVTNNGPLTAGSVSLTDNLPGGVTYVSATPTQGTCGHSLGVVTCNLLNMLSTQIVQVVIVVNVPPGATGFLVNQAQVSSLTADPNTANNSATATTTVIAQADLQINKSGTPPSLPPGETLTYTLNLVNIGPSNATGVEITDALPTAVNLVSATPSQGTCSGTTTVVCNMGTVLAGGGAVVTIVADVDGAATPGVILNTATVSALTADPIPANNSSQVGTTISDAIVDLTLQKNASAGNVNPGDQLTYTLTVSNAGPSVAANIVLTDTLPAFVSLISATPSVGSCTQANPVVCNLGSLAQGGGANVTILVQVSTMAVGVLNNTASVSTTTADSNLLDNSANTATTVTPYADLFVSISDEPDPVLADMQALTYTLFVYNTGPAAAADVVLTANLPAEINSFSSNPGSPTCTWSLQVLTCNFGAIPAAGSTNVVVVTDVNTDTLGTITLNADVASPTIDPTLTNNADFEETFVDMEAPTLDWVSPVLGGQIHNVGPFMPVDPPVMSVLLSASASDNWALDRVIFERWDPIDNTWVQIATFFTGPYQYVLDVRELRPLWNQIYARAYDTAGNRTDSFIWLFYWKPKGLPIVRH